MARLSNVAIDCEMVGAVSGEGLAARVSIVNEKGQVLLDKYIRPTQPVFDYRTVISGITPEHLRFAETLPQVNRQVAQILNGRILVGHSLDKDLAALKLTHPIENQRDLALFPPFRQLNRGHPASLKFLAQNFLNRTIQTGEHSSVEDARAAMDIYHKVAHMWHM